MFAEQCAGKPLVVHGDGEQTRCFTHVSDVVKALIMLSENEDCVGEIFNIGSQEEVSINELAETVIKVSESSSEIEHISYDEAYERGFEDMRKRVPDINKIKSFTGWKPERALVNIINDVIQDEVAGS